MAGVAVNNEKNTPDIGSRLEAIRLKADISHEELAHRIGLSRSTYFDVKAGKGGKDSVQKTLHYLARLAQSEESE